jgi:hypothetical protein
MTLGNYSNKTNIFVSRIIKESEEICKFLLFLL